jgi:predicted membrane chloride channel (bestrophin family)
MIVRPKPTFLNIVSAIKGSIAKRIALRCLMVTVASSRCNLPIDAIVRTIEREILAALGKTQLPPALEPLDFVLG